MTDDIDYEKLADQMIAKLREMGLSRREMLAAMTGAGAAGLGVATLAGQAQAQTISGIIKADQIGTSSDPVQELYVDNQTNFSESETFDDITVNNTASVGTLDTDDGEVTNAPTGDDDILRWQEGVEVGQVVVSDGDGLTGAADDGWDSFVFKSVSVTFNSSFVTTPKVCATINGSKSQGENGVRAQVGNVTSSGFELFFIQYGTLDNDTNNNDIAADWIAADGRS